jgi:hypothetical protein
MRRHLNDGHFGKPCFRGAAWLRCLCSIGFFQWKPEDVGHELLDQFFKSRVVASTVCAVLLHVCPASGAALSVPVKCVVSGKSEPGIGDVICREFIQHLSKTYGDHQFKSAEQLGAGPALAVTLSNISKHGMKIKLAWTAKDGRTVEGDEMSLVVTDHELTPVMRASLYQQATSRTPMPR